jgi:nitroreductase
LTISITEEANMLNKPATTGVDIHTLMQTRWSPRAFDPSKTISNNDITAVLEAARWSPSCFNDQPWRFVVCVKATDENAWQQALSSLAEKNQQWAKNAPVLILAAAMHNFTHNGNPNRHAQYDTGAASLSLALQATALGLVVHQMGGFDAVKAKQLFNLPDDCTPMSMIALGYQADPASLDEDFKQAELAERKRIPLEQMAYFGGWRDA